MFNFKRKPEPTGRPDPVGPKPLRHPKIMAWVKLEDGRVGYVDHFKSDGSFGIRPVTEEGLHYPNPSPHWSEEDRIRFPEELALRITQFRAATSDEIPRTYRTG